MNESPKLVLIGDASDERRQALEQILEAEFLTERLTGSTWDQLKRLAQERRAGGISLILLADDLPENESDPMPGPAYLCRRLGFLFEMTRHAGTQLGVIRSNDARLPIAGIDFQYLALRVPGEGDELRFSLGGVLQRAPRTPSIDLAPDDEMLRLQIQSLVPAQSLEEGKSLLARLGRDFFAAPRLTVQRLSQGLSGASVFHVIAGTPEGEPREYVLKLFPANERWKAIREITRHAQAQATLSTPPYRTHLPVSIPSRLQPRDPAMAGKPTDEDAMAERYVVSAGKFCAICYGFLGGPKLGPLLDLATILIVSRETLIQHCAQSPLLEQEGDGWRLALLHAVLSWLRKEWHSRPGATKRESIPLWRMADAPEGEGGPRPPYSLTGKAKRTLAGFLDGPGGELGPRLMPQEWPVASAALRRLLQAVDQAEYPRLSQPIPVLLSPAHGDLNARNVLVWPNRPDHPFLIDFPHFQRLGHALQDLARLEVEMMLGVLDRQHIPGVPVALDFTHSQLPLWMEWHDHLLEKEIPNEGPVWKNAGPAASANSVLQFVRTIRQHAVQVQRFGFEDPMPTFFEEYLAPLLYYTVRSICYDSISPFKRLLGVYAAGNILQKLARSGASSTEAGRTCAVASMVSE